MRCVIVDDSRPLLDAARSLLEDQGMTVVAVASTSAEALHHIRRLRPDVTLVDVDLGGESGVELAARLHGADLQHPPPVILMSSEPDFCELPGIDFAAGFLPKQALSADAIRQVLSHPQPRRRGSA